ncbi:MAG: DUF3833 family protein [Pseudomonadota bacterium]
MIQSITSSVTAFAASLNGAASPAGSSAQGHFVLEDFFEGHTFADATFSAINGVRRHFRIEINGVWSGGVLSLHEVFTFDDGETDQKTWHFEKVAKGKYIANREDLLQPVEAVIRDDTLRYTYSLYLDSDQKKNVVLFKDRITLLDDHTLKNRAVVHKFGLPVGMVKGTFTKHR